MAALLILAPMTVAFGVGPVAAQGQPYSVTVVTPDDFSTDGNQTIEVQVTDNVDDGNDFLNPLIEIPISGAISLAPNAEQNVYINDDPSQLVAAQVESSSFTSGDALVITGTVVPDNETRTYHFNVTASNPSTTTITADVRPLYNEDQNVRNSTVTEILGTGTLDVAVEDVDGTPAGSGDAVIDGEERGQSVTATVVEGEHEVSVEGIDGDYPNFTVDVSVGETESVTFVNRSDDEQVQPIAYTADDITPVTETVSRNDGGPETAVNTTISSTFSKDSGTVVYEIQEPDIPVQGVSSTAVASGGNLVDSSTTDGAAQLTINETGTTTQVDVVYEGFPLGDINRDGTVDDADATALAQNVSVGASPPYADVNDDGKVSPIDAMFIAQYADDPSDPPNGYTGVS